MTKRLSESGSKYNFLNYMVEGSCKNSILNLDQFSQETTKAQSSKKICGIFFMYFSKVIFSNPSFSWACLFFSDYYTMTLIPIRNANSNATPY